MKKNKNCLTRYVSLMLIAAGTIFFQFQPLSEAAATTQYETPAVLDASELLDGISLKGDLYQIDSKVPTDGFLMTFTVQSDFGTFHPQSPEMVKTLLVEIAAIKQLDDYSKTDVFIEGLAKSGKEIGNEIKTLVTEPVETVKGMGTGIGRFFERTYRATKTGVQKIGDKVAEDEPVDEVVSGAGSKLPGATSGNAKESSESDLAEASVKMAGNTVVNIFGYSEQRRQLAKQLHVDPYTTNIVLSEKLDEVAWAAFAGGLGVTAIKTVIPAAMVLSATTTLTDWVWDLPPGDLKVLNEKALLAMGVSQDSVDSFLRNPWYTHTLQGRLVHALVALEDVEDRPEVIGLALTVISEDQARFVTESAEMLGHYHTKGNQITRVDITTTIIGQSKAGGIIIPAPLDYVSWTKKLETFTSRDDFKNKDRRILVRGRFSEIAKNELTQKNWLVTETESN